VEPKDPPSTFGSHKKRAVDLSLCLLLVRKFLARNILYYSESYERRGSCSVESKLQLAGRGETPNPRVLRCGCCVCHARNSEAAAAAPAYVERARQMRSSLDSAMYVAPIPPVFCSNLHAAIAVSSWCEAEHSGSPAAGRASAAPLLRVTRAQSAKLTAAPPPSCPPCPSAAARPSRGTCPNCRSGWWKSLCQRAVNSRHRGGEPCTDL
jgi:hypothetical protein